MSLPARPKSTMHAFSNILIG